MTFIFWPTVLDSSHHSCTSQHICELGYPVTAVRYWNLCIL